MVDTTIQSTTQLFLDIHDITNNVLIMKDGTTSVVITVDAMNFGLLAEEEQDGIMYAYAGLLNSLNYPIQIVIKSQTKDVTGYLQLLKDQEEKTTNRTIQRRIQAYREFVANLIYDRNVLDKKFYVVIPATSLELGLLAPQSVLPGSAKFDISSVDKNMIIEKALNILEPKRDHLISQFARIGLFSKQLNTQELIQLFYISYNPEAVEGQQLADTSNYTTPLVTTGAQRAFMNNQPSIQSTVVQTSEQSQPTPPSPNMEVMPLDQAMPPTQVMPTAQVVTPMQTMPTTQVMPPEQTIAPAQNQSITPPASPMPTVPTPQSNELQLAQDEINKTLNQLNQMSDGSQPVGTIKHE